MSLYESIKSSLKESEEGIRKKQLINNIEALLYSYDVSINDGYAEPFKSDEEMVDYVYRQVFDLKDDGTGFTKWVDGICDDLKYLGKDYIVNEIKRIGHEIGVVQMKESEETKNNDSIQVIKDLIDNLLSQGKLVKEDNVYFYIGEADYFKGLKYDEEILKTLIRHFDNDVIIPLRNIGISIVKSFYKNDYGSYTIDYYTDDDSLSIGVGTLTSDDFDNLLDKETYYAEDIPYIGIK